MEKFQPTIDSKCFDIIDDAADIITTIIENYLYSVSNTHKRAATVDDLRKFLDNAFFHHYDGIWKDVHFSVNKD